MDVSSYYFYSNKMPPSTEFAPGLVVKNLPAQHKLADFKLIAFDMDSTLINIECVDEIADAAGRKAEVAAITEAAMQGVITDYKESLRQRVALLRGVPVAHMEQVLRERMQSAGAKVLVMDVGVLEPGSFTPEISNNDVAVAAGSTMSA